VSQRTEQVCLRRGGGRGLSVLGLSVWEGLITWIYHALQLKVDVLPLAFDLFFFLLQKGFIFWQRNAQTAEGLEPSRVCPPQDFLFFSLRADLLSFCLSLRVEVLQFVPREYGRVR
jgi:hypothetical protein